MKNISFLYSAQKNKFPKTAFLLQDGKVATIDEKMDEDQEVGNEVSLNAISDTTIENIVWWWPSGSAFREINGISEFAIINLFKDFGFSNISPNTRLNHTQVEDDDDVLKDYIEIVLSLSDKRYKELVSQYGKLKLYTPFE